MKLRRILLLLAAFVAFAPAVAAADDNADLKEIIKFTPPPPEPLSDSDLAALRDKPARNPPDLTKPLEAPKLGSPVPAEPPKITIPQSILDQEKAQANAKNKNVFQKVGGALGDAGKAVGGAVGSGAKAVAGVATKGFNAVTGKKDEPTLCTSTGGEWNEEGQNCDCCPDGDDGCNNFYDPDSKTCKDNSKADDNSGKDNKDTKDAKNKPDAATLGKLCEANPDDPKCADLADKKQAAAEAKAREQSTANKMIGAAAIGAGGLGVSQMMQGMAEKSADESAAQAIAAYTATIKCGIPGTYVMNVKNGDSGIAPAYSDKFIGFRTQYIGIAGQMKSAKEALGMTPGIEAQLVDKSSLYDYGSEGQGGFKSVLDTAQQRLDSGEAQKKINTGMTTAAVGLGVGLAGNLLVNDIAPKLGAGDPTKYGGASVSQSQLQATYASVSQFYQTYCAGGTMTTSVQQSCATLNTKLQAVKVNQ